jgi:uncharacterized protein YndB with AHSA1/START domain
MSDIRIVRDYPHPPAKVWRAVTDPALIPLWTATGAGGRAEGFTATVGTKFQLVAKPKPGWSGVVDCEVLEVNEPSLLRYSWTGDDGGDVTEVVYRLEPHAGGTRFTYEHTGFNRRRRGLHGQAAGPRPQEDAHRGPARGAGRSR